MRVRLTSLLVLGVCGGLGARAGGAIQTSSELFGDLRPGIHAVGFRTFVDRDASRAPLPGSIDTTARVMPIAVWYPARQGQPAAMSLADYVAAGQVMIGATPDPAALDTYRSSLITRGAETSSLDRLLHAPMLASRDARAGSARFPLLLFAHAAPESQSIMAEYLASHGFVVASIRSRGTSELAYRLSRENLDTMVRDLEFLWSRMQGEPNVRQGPAGVIGMSNGSIGAVALQLRRPVLAAVVSLDGGIGEDAGGDFLRERSGDDPSRLQAPILHFYAPNNPHLDLSHLRSFQASERLLIFVRGMRHQDFLNAAVVDTILRSPPGLADARPGFEWVAHYTLRFFQAKLNRDRESAEWLAIAPERHGAPAGLLTIERLAARARQRPESDRNGLERVMPATYERRQ